MALQTTKDKQQGKTVFHQTFTYTDEVDEAYQEVREHLKNNQTIMALVGDVSSSRTLYLSELAKEFQIPHLSFFATDDSIFEENPWSFSYRYRYADELEILQTIIDYLDSPSMVVISCDISSIFNRGQDFIESMEYSGETILQTVDVEHQKMDFTDFIEELKSNDELDLIVTFLNEDQFVHFLQQLNREMPHLPVLTTGLILHPQMLSSFLGIHNPIYSFAPYYYLSYLEDTEIHSFFEEYKISLGVHRIDSIAPWIYDGFLLLHSLLPQAKSPSQLREALETYQGDRLLGPIYFNQKGFIESNTLVPVEIHSKSFHELSYP